jgi:hypothetical protein
VAEVDAARSRLIVERAAEGTLATEPKRGTSMNFRPSVLPVGADRTEYILVVTNRRHLLPWEMTHLAMPTWTTTVCGIRLPAIASEMRPKKSNLLRCSRCHYTR